MSEDDPALPKATVQRRKSGKDGALALARKTIAATFKRGKTPSPPTAAPTMPSHTAITPADTPLAYTRTAPSHKPSPKSASTSRFPTLETTAAILSPRSAFPPTISREFIDMVATHAPSELYLATDAAQQATPRRHRLASAQPSTPATAVLATLLLGSPRSGGSGGSEATRPTPPSVMQPPASLAAKAESILLTPRARAAAFADTKDASKRKLPLHTPPSVPQLPLGGLTTPEAVVAVADSDESNVESDDSSAASTDSSTSTVLPQGAQRCVPALTCMCGRTGLFRLTLAITLLIHQIALSVAV